MRENPHHAVTDEGVVRTLIAENPWATLVSTAPGGDLVASHYPVLLDEDAPEGRLVLVTHVGRPDDQVHGFGAGRSVLVIFQGPHGYVSPGWYVPGTTPAPTWNFSVVHAHGVPSVLDGEENLRVLTRLVAHFEDALPQPMPLDPDAGARLARGTVGLRIPVDRWTCKVKMSQDKPPESRARVLAELRGDGPYASPALAADMERALERGWGKAREA